MDLRDNVQFKRTVEAGVPLARIAAAIGLNYNAVYYRARCLGLRKPEARSRDKRKYDPFLFRQMWAANVLATHIMGQFGIKNKQCVRRIARSLGCSIRTGKRITVTTYDAIMFAQKWKVEKRGSRVAAMRSEEK